MSENIIEIEWEGPLSIDRVIETKHDCGSKGDDWGGCDYGVYQIYGSHILCGEEALLYIGQVHEQVFSERFKEHKKDLLIDDDLEKIKIHLGRIDNTPKYPNKYTSKNNWESWRKDVDITEAVLVYKYSPNYNSQLLQEHPNIAPYNEIKLVHKGNRGKIHFEDNAPKDYKSKRITQ